MVPITPIPISGYNKENFPDYYEIHLQGCLDTRWFDWFGGMQVSVDLDNNETILSGPVVDQAQLHGVLAAIRDLNLVLISVRRASQNPES